MHFIAQILKQKMCKKLRCQITKSLQVINLRLNFLKTNLSITSWKSLGRSQNVFQLTLSGLYQTWKAEKMCQISWLWKINFTLYTYFSSCIYLQMNFIVEKIIICSQKSFHSVYVLSLDKWFCVIFSKKEWCI